MKRILLLLFATYFLASAVIYSLALMTYRAPGFDPLVGLPFVLGTFFMAASVMDYRKRILKGGRYPRSLRTFQIVYWIGTIGLFILLPIYVHSVVMDFAYRVSFLLILSSFYAPIDLLSRLTVAVRKRRAGLPSIR
jgi:hypothetical protein